MSFLVFYTAITAFALSFLMTPIVIALLTKQQILDIGGHRKIHKGFIPSMGGIAIFFGFLFSIAIWIPLSFLAPYKFLLAACCIIFFTGLRDDFVALSPRGKLIMQLLAAGMVVWGGGDPEESIRIVSFYGLLGIHQLPLFISYPLTIFVFIVVTNAFNLIDGLDGLAGFIGLLAFTLLSMWFLQVGNATNNGMTFAFLLVAMLGALLAFLCFNWHPASIFMGDTGSLLLGFFLSVGVVKFLTVNGAPDFVSDFKFNAPISMAAVVAIIPLFDTGRIFTLRLSQGRSPFSPDKLHVHHLLLRMGLHQQHVAFIMGGLYFTLVAMIFFLSQYFSDNVLVPFLLLLCVAMHFALTYIVTVRFDRKRARVQQSVLLHNN